MEIKKSLWLLIKFSLLTSFFVGCQNLGIKSRPRRVEVKQETDAIEVSKAPQIDKPEFLKKAAPRLGLILGGGGALSLAHVGFLQELEEQKVPVHAIAGIEWGALVAGAYATKNKAHAIEWKLLKIPYKKFNKSSFFSSGKSSANVSEFSEYLTDVFKNAKFDDLEIPFSCAYLSLAKETVALEKRGHLKNAIRNCLPSPPHFSVDTIAAHLTSVSQLAQDLRNSGADIVVYVDVLSKNQLFSNKDRKSSVMASLLWTQAKSMSVPEGVGAIDAVVRLPLSGFHMNSYSSLRSIVRAGQLKAKSSVKRLVKQYDY